MNLLENIDVVDKAAMLFFAAPFPFVLWWGRSVGSSDAAWTAYLTRCFILVMLGTLFSAMLLEGLVLPLLLAIPAGLATIYPTRRRVFQESWSLWRYLAFELRVMIGVFGTWFALAFMPALVRALPEQPVGAAPIGALVLAACLISLHRRLLPVEALEDAALAATFAPVLERARCPRPALLRMVPKGGRFANALALPHLRSPRVIFGQTLLDELTPAELAAILGHELAHLEHYDRSVSRRYTGAFYALLALSAVVVPLAAAIIPKHLPQVVIFWPLIMWVGLNAWRASERANEADSDLRGIELAGDPEAMISALTKIHILAGIPRRFDPDLEHSLSHPSLARRIHNIRAVHEGAATAQATPSEVLIVEVANDPRCQLIFDREQLLIAFGAPEAVAREPAALTAAAFSVRSIAYRDLTSAQVTSSLRGPRLHARTREGELLEFRLRVAELPHIQRALDRIADLFTYRPAAPTKVRNAQRIAALVLLAISPLPRELPIAVTLGAALLVIATTSGALRAMSALCVSTFALMLAWSTPWAALDAKRYALLVLLAAVALICGWWSTAAQGGGKRSSFLAVAAAICGCALLLGIGLLAQSAEPFHDALQRIPSLPLALIAFGAGLWVGASRAVRALASLALVAGMASLIAGSAAFYAHITAEPVLAGARSLQLQRITPRVTHEIAFERASLGEVAISPSGAWAAFGREAPRGEPPSRYTLVARDGTRRSFHTAGVAAIDDRRALILDRDLLRVVTLTEERPESEVRLEGASSEAEFGFEPASGRYWLRSLDEQSPVELEGVLGAPPDARRTLRLPADVFPEPAPPSAIQLGMSMTAEPPSERLRLLQKLRLLRHRTSYSAELWSISQQRVSRLLRLREHAECRPHGRDGRHQVCLTSAARSCAWKLDLETGRVRPIGVFPTFVHGPSLRADTLAVSSARAVYVLDVNSGQAREYPLEPNANCGYEAELLPQHIAVIRRCDRHTRVQFWAR